MTKPPTEERVEARLEILPENIRAAIFSVEITKIGEDIGLSKGLKDENIPYLADVIAWVMMGFLHSSGAAQAIQEHVGVPAEKAKAVADELSAKLFSKYGADLEKIYTPAGGMAGAKMVDVATAAPTVPVAAPPVMPTAPMPVPITGLAPRITSGALRPAVSSPTSPKINPVTVTPTPTPAVPVVPSAPGAAAARPAAPAPFILHQESTAAPLAPGSDFRLNLSKSMFKPAPAAPAMNIPRPARPAELEIGKAPIPAKPASAAPIHVTPPSTSRVVHYTDLKTIVAPTFGAAVPAAVPAATPTKPASPTPAPTVPTPAPLPVTPAQPPAQPPKQPPMPAQQAPAQPDIAPPNKPPKVVNFGPEEVK